MILSYGECSLVQGLNPSVRFESFNVCLMLWRSYGCSMVIVIEAIGLKAEET